MYTIDDHINKGGGARRRRGAGGSPGGGGGVQPSRDQSPPGVGGAAASKVGEPRQRAVQRAAHPVPTFVFRWLPG